MKFDKDFKRKLCASMLNIAIFFSIFSGMLILLLTMIAPNASAAPGDTIYVDITNDDPLRNGSEENPFKYIQEAVTHAGEEHSGNVTIRVYDGTYPETITINSGPWDTLTLQGNGSDTTTIDAQGSGTVIEVSASWINITGFTIKNGGGGKPYGIWMKSDNNKIWDCNITENSKYGICLNGSYGAHNNTIAENNIYINDEDGLYLSKSDGNIVENNNIINNGGSGIYLWLYSNQNKIIRNNIMNNSKGIYMRLFSGENNVTGNNISYNGYGIMIHPDFGLGSPCDNNWIVDNNNTYNDFDGIFLVHSSDNNIIGNNISHNGAYGLHLYGASNNNTIVSNTLYNNTVGSIHLRTLSNENRIINNTIYFGNYGIALNSELEPSAGACVNNYFFNNTIICANYSIFIYKANNNTFYNTTIINPEIYGLFIKTNIETNYINFLPTNNTVNDDPIHYYYDEHDLIFSNPENLTQHKVTNVGKITLYACSKITISNKTISNGTIGIFIHSSDNITLDDNIISNMTEVGLHIENGYWHYITLNNTVDGEIVYYYTNRTGIKIENLNLYTWNVSNVGKITLAYCKNVYLINNNVSHNDFGIFLWGCKDITMWENTMPNPKIAGLFIEEGFHHYIEQNNTANGEVIFYFTDLHGSEISPILKNIYTRTNKYNNLYHTNVGLISFVNCSYIIIENNTLNYNYGSGLFIASSFNITVRNNTDHYNGNGMWLESSTNTSITSNDLCYNKYNSVWRWQQEEYYGKWAGIHVRNCKSQGWNGNILHNNTILYKNNFGILVESSSGNIIENHNDTIYDSQGAAICIMYSSTRIRNNNLTDNPRIVSAYYSSPIIENNYFDNEDRWIPDYKKWYSGGSGIFLYSCDESSKVLNNTLWKFGTAAIYTKYSSPEIRNNTLLGEYVRYFNSNYELHSGGSFDAITLYHGDNKALVVDNYISNFAGWGVVCEDSNATVDNNIINDTHYGLGAHYNPHVKDPSTCSNVIFVNNTITNAKRNAIIFNTGSIGKVLNNTIKSTNATIDPDDGGAIFLEGGDYGNPHPDVYNNTIIDNPTIGVHVKNGAYSIISGNNISGNIEGINIKSTNPSSIIKNNIFENNHYGIRINALTTQVIINNYVNGSLYHGIYAIGTNNLKIENNSLNNNNYSISLKQSNSNQITNNTIKDNDYGLFFYNQTPLSADNIIYHNNIINNTVQAYDLNSANNDWHHTTLLEGNFWSDYTGLDDGSGSGKHAIAGDGIGDTEIPHPTTDFDFYPLMWPTFGGPVHNIDTDEYFDFIQPSINDKDTMDGHTIEVEAGYYKENVVLNKSVTLKGVDMNYTIIDGNASGDVVKITADWVNITGFTINNSGSSDGDTGTELNSVQNCYIANNSIKNNTKGILLNSSSHNNIYNNTISSNGQQGIEFANSNWNNIESNIVSSNSWEGINMKNTSNNNTITECAIILNTGWGISIDSSDDNNLNNNSISNNSIGIYTYQTSNTLIEENIISYNDCGIQMYYASPIIQYNDISYNIGNGIGEIYYTDIQLCNNTITYNSASGICNVLYSNGTIDNNTISYNNEGISCFQYSSPSVTYNNITYNSIGINSRSGSNASIHWNNIYDNENYNLKNLDEEIIIDATYNYWGSDDENDILEGLYGEVTYDPWLSNPVQEAGPD